MPWLFLSDQPLLFSRGVDPVVEPNKVDTRHLEPPLLPTGVVGQPAKWIGTEPNVEQVGVSVEQPIHRVWCGGFFMELHLLNSLHPCT